MTAIFIFRRVFPNFPAICWVGALNTRILCRMNVQYLMFAFVLINSVEMDTTPPLSGPQFL